MGCDIHLYVERRQADGTWKILPPPSGGGVDLEVVLHAEPKIDYEAYERSLKTPYRYENARNPSNPAWDRDEDRLISWFTDRNYNLFALLAGVREDLEPIAEPRGVPKDASEDYRRYVEIYGDDGHTHSFYTVEELLSHFEGLGGDEFLQSGILSGGAFEALLVRGEQPEKWCKGIGGGDILTVDAATYILLRPHIELVDTHSFYGVIARLHRDRAPSWFRREHPGHSWALHVEAVWPRTYRDAAGRFLDFLREVQEFGDPKDLRVVFFFDN